MKNVFSDASLDLDNDEPYLLFTKDGEEEEKIEQLMDSASKRTRSLNIIKPPLASKKAKGISSFSKKVDQIKELIQ